MRSCWSDWAPISNLRKWWFKHILLCKFWLKFLPPWTTCDVESGQASSVSAQAVRKPPHAGRSVFRAAQSASSLCRKPAVWERACVHWQMGQDSRNCLRGLVCGNALTLPNWLLAHGLLAVVLQSDDSTLISSHTTSCQSCFLVSVKMISYWSGYINRYNIFCLSFLSDVNTVVRPDASCMTDT